MKEDSLFDMTDDERDRLVDLLSQIPQGLPGKAVVVRFFLGQATELEQMWVCVNITNGDFYALTGKVEARLIEQYITGRLQKLDREAFIIGYLTTRDRQMRVFVLARAIHKKEVEQAKELAFPKRD